MHEQFNLIVERSDIPEQACEVCGVLSRPRWKSQRRRFCGQVCYHIWWKANGVQARATAKGSAGATRTNARVRTRDAENGRFASSKSTKAKPTAAATLDDPVDTWRARAEYWQGVTNEKEVLRRTPFGWTRLQPRSLVIAGHGARMSVDQGCLMVRPGRTHHPQDTPETRYFPADKALPPRIILLDPDGLITFDAMAWLARHEVPVIQLGYRGEVVSVMGSTPCPYDPDLRRAQFEAIDNGVGLELATQLIRRKIEACLENLHGMWKSTSQKTGVLQQIRALAAIKSPPTSYDQVRLIEATAAAGYFAAWQDIPLSWKGTERRPIPPEWHRCGMRQGLLGDRNRNSSHPTSSMLNFAFALLESEMRIAMVAAGLDPEIGFLHVRKPGRLSLAYDAMEPLRPVVERMVLDFVKRHTFSPADFILTQNGVCRLHPQMTRRLLGVIQLGHACQPLIDLLALSLSKGGR